MQRVLSVWLPTWSIDRYRRRRARARSGPVATKPSTGRAARARQASTGDPVVVLVDEVAGQQVIRRVCLQGRRLGVRPDMRLAEARPLVTGAGMGVAGAERLVVAPFQPARDEAALEALAAWAQRFSPVVAADPPDGLLLDIQGCAHLHGGEAALRQAVLEAVRALGLRARAAIASTVGCAWAVARHLPEPPFEVDAGQERAVLADLPVEALRLEPGVAEGLREINVSRVGDLFAVPRGGWSARFGSDLLLRLDQALGQAIERVGGVRLPEPLEVAQAFEEGTSSLDLVRDAGRLLVERLVAALQDQGLAVRDLEVLLDVQTAHAEGGRPVGTRRLEERIALTRASQDAAHLTLLVHARLERMPWNTPVMCLTLRTTHGVPLRTRQHEAWETVRHGSSGPRRLDQALGELLDQLVDQCGASCVQRLEPVASHVPERAFRSTLLVADGRDPAASGASWTDGLAVVAGDRPTHLFPRPEPIETIALVPDGPPVWMRWREAAVRVVQADGPERIGAPWWGAPPRDGPPRDGPAAGDDILVRGQAFRDYYRIGTETGQWLWVYRGAESGRWYVHGEWA